VELLDLKEPLVLQAQQEPLVLRVKLEILEHKGQ
jgi:hypothetical protein